MPSKVVDLERFRLTKAVCRVEGMFEARFGVSLGPETTPAELPDRVLAFLIEGKAAATEFVQDMIIRLLALGRGISFHYLAKPDKMAVLDSYFFLLDQLRFEAMRRLGWVSSYPGQGFPVVLIAVDPDLVKSQGGPLELSSDHPSYPEFRLRRDLDGEVVVRRLIPKAIAAFQEKAGTNGSDGEPSPA